MECVILVGLPGAGKTTFHRQNFAASHRHVSRDLWPNASGRDAFVGSIDRARAAEAAWPVVEKRLIR